MQELETVEMNGVQRAVSCFDEGFSCSQSVLSAFGPELGLDRETALRVASAFGGGMGRRGETCGAVTGAFMVIGLKCGRSGTDDQEAKETAYTLVNEFVDEFESRNGSVICRELLGCDIGTAEGLELTRQMNLRTTRCAGFVRDAGEIIEQILEF